MPDILDATGLQIKTASEIQSDLISGLRGIYGADINVDSNSPDGQVVGIVTQAAVDVREKIAQTYNSFDPDRSVGRQLDERVTINNVKRAGGSFTIIDITITTNATIVLPGLDGSFNDINGVGYTVSDNAGTQFILIDTTTITAGTHVLPFRAKTIGLVETTIGTITNQVTIVLGVIGVNNGSAPTTIGQNEETDAQLRLRRQRSVSLSSNGYLNGLRGLLLGLQGVTGAEVFENRKNVTDADGIPPHAVWVIVEGGSNADIGNAIYSRKSYGCDLKGDIDVVIPTPSGGSFVASFDRPTSRDLYIRFDIKRTNPTQTFSLDAIRTYMVGDLIYAIGDFAETSLATAAAVAGIAAQGGGGVPINVEISSDGVTWTDFLPSPTLDSKWTLDPTRITITVV